MMELRKRVLALSMTMALCGGGLAFAEEIDGLEAAPTHPQEEPQEAEERQEAPEETPQQQPTTVVPVTVPDDSPEAQDPHEATEAPAGQEPPPVAQAVPHDPRGTQEWLEPAEEEVRRFGLGVGLGLVDAGPTTEPYFMAGFRIRFGQRDHHTGGLGGYIEPELGYWERDALGLSERDILLGVNVGGLVQLRAVSYFVAAGVGLHFIDIDRLGEPDDATSVGVNIQFGVDVHFNPTISVFGVGRLDLVEEWDNETQAKIYLGLRFHF